MSETRAALQSRLAGRLGSAAEARWVVEELLGRPSPATGAPALSADTVTRADALVDRRLAGEPLQYVLGTWAFRRLELAVDPRALIPRPETEQVAGAAMAEVRRLARAGGPGDGPVVVDLGTGTGAIALSMAAELAGELPGLTVWATDVAPAALALAAENLDRVAAPVPGLRAHVRLARGSWYGALPAELAGRVAVVVSNPPYVSTEEWPALDPEVRAEPFGALVAGPSSDGTPGLADVEAVLGGAADWLMPDGAVVVELAPHQAEAAVALAGRMGLVAVRVVDDLAGKPRAVVGRRPVDR